MRIRVNNRLFIPIYQFIFPWRNNPLTAMICRLTDDLRATCQKIELNDQLSYKNSGCKGLLSGLCGVC